MADAPTPGDPATPENDPDPDAGAKKALEAERKARRDAEKQLKDVQAQLKEIGDKDKSEGDKLRDELAAAKKERDDHVAKLLKLEVGSAKGLTTTQSMRLSGTTKEELEADADSPDFVKSAAAPPVPGKPTADLKGGGDPTEEPPVDVRKVVESIPRGY